MSQKLDTSPAVIGIDIGKNSFHIIGQNQRGAIVLRQKWSRGQVEARLANLPPCRIGMEACVGAHHLSRTLTALGHDNTKPVPPRNDLRNTSFFESAKRDGLNCLSFPVRLLRAIPGKFGAGRCRQKIRER